MKMDQLHPAIEFYQYLYRRCENGFLNFRCLPSGKSIFVDLKNINTIPALLWKHRTENVYCGVATHEKDNGTKMGIVKIPALHVDLDLYKFNEKEQAEIYKQIEEFVLKPTALIYSGGGKYLFWFLKEPAQKEEVPHSRKTTQTSCNFFSRGHGRDGCKPNFKNTG